MVINPLLSPLHPASLQSGTFLHIEYPFLCAAPCIKSLQLVRALTSVSRVYCSAVKILPGLKLDRKMSLPGRSFCSEFGLNQFIPFPLAGGQWSRIPSRLFFVFLKSDHCAKAVHMAGSTQTTVLSAALAQGHCQLLAGAWPYNEPGSIPLLVQLLAWMMASVSFVLRLLRASLAMVQTGTVHPCCCCLRAQPTVRQNHLGYTSSPTWDFWLFSELGSMYGYAPVVEAQVSPTKLQTYSAILAWQVSQMKVLAQGSCSLQTLA